MAAAAIVRAARVFAGVGLFAVLAWTAAGCAAGRDDANANAGASTGASTDAPNPYPTIDRFYFADLGYQGPRSFVEVGGELVRLRLPGFFVTENEGHHPNSTVEASECCLTARPTTTSGWSLVGRATGRTRERDDGDAVFQLREYQIAYPESAQIRFDPATGKPELNVDLGPPTEDPHRPL